MHVCSDKTGQADLDSIPASGEQKLHEQQAPGHQLSWDREDIEMSILAALILRGCIAHANQESLKVTASTSKDLVQGNGDASDNHQIPNEVLFPCKFVIGLLKLGKVCIDKVRVKEDVHVGTGQEETRYEAVNAWGERP